MPKPTTKLIADTTGDLERLGNLRLLHNALDDKLADSIKAQCAAEDATHIQSDHFLGRVDGGGIAETGAINVGKFVAMCKRHKIPTKTMQSVLKVTKKDITFLSADAINACCEPGGPMPRRLTVERRKDVAAPSLLAAVDALANDARAKLHREPGKTTGAAA